MAGERVTFFNAEGVALTGDIERPERGPVRAFALFAHCFTCTRNIRAARAVTRALAAEGIGVLRFDFTGLGDSEGDFADTNFSSNVGDLLAAAEYLAEREQAPALLVGHSLGGAAVLRAAALIPSARAVATIGAPADPAHVTHLLLSKREEIARSGEAVVQLAGRPFRVKRQFIDDLQGTSPEVYIGKLRKALLVMHAPLDATVPIDNATRIFQAARHPKSFVSLDDADHLLSREEDAQYAATVLAAWAARYLPAAIAGRAAPMEAPARDEVVARTETGFQTRIDAGGHALLADEPAAVGGSNLGPSPYGLLSAALAACTTMTLRMYADRKKLPLAAVTVRVRHNKIHAEDCADCETATGRLDQFERTVEFEGHLDADQRKRMLEIADRCPVHRTLHGEVRVTTRLGAQGND
jgi:uncharacterized OsmC-like protein/pimeloyl-ACP methyl ester carboxylesterase